MTNIDRTVVYAIGFVLILPRRFTDDRSAQHRHGLAAQRSIAASLQAALGVGWQSIPGCTIGAAYVSATSEAEVGATC